VPLLAVVVELGVVFPVAAVPVLLSVDEVGGVAMEPSGRRKTGAASELSEFTVPLVSGDVEFVALVVLWVVEVEAGREGSGQLLLCESELLGYVESGA
jgi:hypothetical protein